MEPTASKHIKSYYEDLGRESDFILRCHECRRLVLHSDLVKQGGCKCGNRRVIEVRSLSVWEWFLIWAGVYRFPYRKEFLREFRRER